MDRLVSVLSLLLALVVVSSGASLPTSRIVGGLPVEDNEFPWIVSLRRNNIHFCGGSIINRRWILTNAFCLLNEDVSSIRVVTNTRYLNSGGDHYPAFSFVIHPEFNESTTARNLGLVHVAMNIVLDIGVQPARLPTRAEDEGIVSPIDPLKIAGWGSTSWADPIASNQLLYFTPRIATSAECRRYFPQYITEEHICSYDFPRGICFGDGGGPLMYNNGTLLGVLSFYQPCALGSPDVSTRVFTHLDWINSVTAN